VVAGHGDDLCTGASECEQRLDENALRIGAGRGGVVQVASDEDGVDLMLLGEADLAGSPAGGSAASNGVVAPPGRMLSRVPFATDDPPPF